MSRSSGTTDGPVVVAIVNTNPDLVRLLRVALEQAGFVVLVMHIEELRRGSTDLDVMLGQHDPKVVVYDVAPPYEHNWRFFEHLRTATGFRGRQFVLTSVNKRLLKNVVKMHEDIYEVDGEGQDIVAVVRGVKEASRARPTK